MTNWEKIASTLKQLRPSITIDEFADSLEYCMGCHECAQYKACRKNDKTCSQNLNDWLGQEATDE